MECLDTIIVGAVLRWAALGVSGGPHTTGVEPKRMTVDRGVRKVECGMLELLRRQSEDEKGGSLRSTGSQRWEAAGWSLVW